MENFPIRQRERSASTSLFRLATQPQQNYTLKNARDPEMMNQKSELNCSNYSRRDERTNNDFSLRSQAREEDIRSPPLQRHVCWHTPRVKDILFLGKPGPRRIENSRGGKNIPRHPPEIYFNLPG